MKTNLADAAKLFEQLGHGDVTLLNQGNTTIAKNTAFSDPIITAQAVQVRRDIPAFLHRMKVLANMAGEEYRYQYPVKKKTGGSSTVEGASIKMANDLAREYGNCMVDVRVLDNGNEWVFYARFIDYETGFAMTRPFRQRKNQQTMKDDAERQLDIVYQIGASKAIRNVVINSLQTYADMIYTEAKNSLINNIGKNLAAWRERIVTRCQENKFDIKRIEMAITKPVQEWLAVDVARVVAELKSVMDGMARFDDLFPDVTKMVENDPEPAQDSVESFKSTHAAMQVLGETVAVETQLPVDFFNNTKEEQ
jgi:hypothetical protein